MRRAFPFSAVILIILLVTGSPVQAGPVTFTEVIQVINGLQNPPDLRLNSNTHPDSTALVDVFDQTQSGAKSSADSSTSKGDASLLSGVAVGAPNAQTGAAVVVQGEVDGTVCDCGEIWVPGGFPRWPLLFLAGIPLIFIDSGDDDLPPLPPSNPPQEPPQSEPSPTPTPTPEPASLLLFGTGLAALGAGLRRRYAKSKLGAQSHKEAGVS